MKNYNLDGTVHTDSSAIPPITMEIDGWYFNDEVEQVHGPFSTFEEAVRLFKVYCLDLEP